MNIAEKAEELSKEAPSEETRRATLPVGKMVLITMPGVFWETVELLTEVESLPVEETASRMMILGFRQRLEIVAGAVGCGVEDLLKLGLYRRDWEGE